MLWWGGPRFLFEIALLTAAGYLCDGSDQATLPPAAAAPSVAELVGADGQYCTSGTWTYGGSIAIGALTGVYFLFYLICVMRVHLQLRQQPHSAFRAANILYQLQVPCRAHKAVASWQLALRSM